MVITVGFVVEGPSDKPLIESGGFRDWLDRECNLSVVEAGGNGNLCGRKIPVFVERLKKQANPERVIVLADLDPEECAPCIKKRKAIIGMEGIDLVAIARKTLKSWFLADTEAMRHWTGDSDFFESSPENMMPLRGNWWHHQVLG